MHVDAASGGFVWPFLYPDSPWDFRLEQVRSINVSGHKFGLVYPGIGWLIFREKADLASDIDSKIAYLFPRDRAARPTAPRAPLAPSPVGTAAPATDVA